MNKALYIATTNPGKLRDFAVAAIEHRLQIESLPGLERIPAPAEDEPSFEGNAQQKALYYSAFAPGALVLADDSGLEVDALDGAPGVRSARYAEDAAFAGTQITGETAGQRNDQRNNNLLLAELRSIPDMQRTARYRCALACAFDGECLATGIGAIEGMILTAPRGTGGFGYDPLFFLPDLIRTMAELNLETKHKFSHRGRAFRALFATLQRTHPEYLYD